MDRILFLRINGFTRENRHEMIWRVKNAVNEANGWITDFHQFSNVSLCINFEIEAGNVARLNESLRETNLILEEKSRQAFEEVIAAGRKAARVFGTLQITFIHNEPDLRIECPPIPG